MSWTLWYQYLYQICAMMCTSACLQRNGPCKSILIQFSPVFDTIYQNIFRLDTVVETSQNSSSNVRVGRLVSSNPRMPKSSVMMLRRRMKRSEPRVAKQLIQILENGKICFAGRLLSFDVPSDPTNRQIMINVINTFIDYLSHRRGLALGHLRGF